MRSGTSVQRGWEHASEHAIGDAKIFYRKLDLRAVFARRTRTRLVAITGLQARRPIDALIIEALSPLVAIRR